MQESFLGERVVGEKQYFICSHSDYTNLYIDQILYIHSASWLF